MLRNISLFLCALLAWQGAQAQSWQDTLAKIENAFAQYKPDLPGAQFAISRNGKVIFSKAWGMADIEHNVPLTTHSLIEAGSVSKQFTAASVLMLEQMGKLSVEDDVRKYVPELPDYGQPIKISHLLHHSSGLKDWGSVAAMNGWPRSDRNYTNDDALRIICLQKSLNNAPGFEFIYSNSNYTLLTIIVERVAKQTLEAFTDTHIFRPAGMETSLWRVDLRQYVPNRAMAYGIENGKPFINMPNESVYGHAALLTTAEELLQWNELYTAGKFGSPSLYPKQTQTVPLANGHPADYAAGLSVAPFNGQQAVTHNGATAGYRSSLEYFPEQGMSFAFLSNTSQFDRSPTNPAAVARNIFIPEPPKPDPRPEPVPPIALKEEASRAFTGWYRNEWSGIPRKITFSNGHLYDGNQQLITEGNNRFRSKAGVRYVFEKGDMALATPQNARFLFIREKAPDSTASKTEFTGKYGSEEAEARWTVVLDNKNLVIKMDRPGFTALMKPLYKDAFESEYGLVRFRRDAKNRITGLEVTTSRARRVPFTKTN